MKIYILLIACLVVAGPAARAQHVPDQLNYQAILTDQHGQPTVLSTNTVRVRIYDEAEGGNLIWGETHSVTTSARGLFSVVLGTGTSLGESMEAANLRAAFASSTTVASRFLELQSLNPDGSSQSPMLPRQQFLSVPYAFQANDSQTARGNFRVTGTLYAQSEGAEVGQLIMTNSSCSISAAGDFVVDGYGKQAVSASFNGTSSVQSASADSLMVQGPLEVDSSWTVAGTSVFHQAVSATDPTFTKGVKVGGGIRALGNYQHLWTNSAAAFTNRATGDGFALVYLKTTGFGNDASLVVTVNNNQISLQNQPYSAGAYYSMDFETTACVPVAKDEGWSVAFSSGSHSSSKFDVYWIPFGY